jgi:hypothetical protein
MKRRLGGAGLWGALLGAWGALGCSPTYVHSMPQRVNDGRSPSLPNSGSSQGTSTEQRQEPAAPFRSTVDPASDRALDSALAPSEASNETALPGTEGAALEPPTEPLPFQRPMVQSVPVKPGAPARKYGNLSPAACAKELRSLTKVFKRVGPHKGVATPTRVIGPISGVRFRVPGEKSKFGVLDCRLALTLVEFARFLEARGVSEVAIDNFHRVNAHLPGKRSKRSQHAYGLAVDLRAFYLADGTRWDVEKDWGASLDTEPCGPLATLENPTEHTVGLRTLVCELFEEQIFIHHLTPSYDAAHRNHLHLDIKRDAKSVIIR